MVETRNPRLALFLAGMALLRCFPASTRVTTVGSIVNATDVAAGSAATVAAIDLITQSKGAVDDAHQRIRGWFFKC